MRVTKVTTLDRFSDSRGRSCGLTGGGETTTVGDKGRVVDLTGTILYPSSTMGGQVLGGFRRE